MTALLGLRCEVEERHANRSGVVRSDIESLEVAIASVADIVPQLGVQRNIVNKLQSRRKQPDDIYIRVQQR